MEEAFERLNEAIIETTVSIDDFVQSLKDINHVFICNEVQPEICTKWESEVKTLQPAICTCCGGRIGKNNYCEYCGTRYW